MEPPHNNIIGKNGKVRLDPPGSRARFLGRGFPLSSNVCYPQRIDLPIILIATSHGLNWIPQLPETSALLLLSVQPTPFEHDVVSEK